MATPIALVLSRQMTETRQPLSAIQPQPQVEGKTSDVSSGPTKESVN